MASDDKKKEGRKKRKTPFSIFQGRKDAERLGSRSRREIERATGRGNGNGKGNGNGVGERRRRNR